MAQSSMTTLPASPAAGGQPRPCPYCGTWNEAEFSFCQKCGRQMPALAPSAPPPTAFAPPPPPATLLPPAPGSMAAAPNFMSPGATPFGIAPPTPPGTEPAPVSERPLTDAEKGLLNRRVKGGGAGLARFFGAFLGIVPLVMVGTALMGTPYVPENYIAIVLVSGFLALVVSAVGRSLRMPLTRAVRSGTAHEVYGVPEVQAAPAGQSLVTISELTFRMRSSEAAKLLPGRMNRLTFADGGPIVGGGRQHGGVVTFLLDSNGSAPLQAERCVLVSSPGLEAGLSAAAPVRGMKKGAR